MPTRRRATIRRTPTQAASDRRAHELATILGQGLRTARTATARTQQAAADQAGIGASTFSMLERGEGAAVTLLVWTRAARACGSDLRAYLADVPSGSQPRDWLHLRHQELIARTAAGGRWSVRAEAALDADPARSRAADLLLTRGDEHALFEVWDGFEDVGAALRSWDRRLARVKSRARARGRLDAAPPAPRISGCWAVRATRRNRILVSSHKTIFGSRFAGSATAWLRALSDPTVAMPATAAFLWITVAGDRLYGARWVSDWTPRATVG